MATTRYYGVGRRKKAIARVRLVSGKGKMMVNKLPIEQYFGLETLVDIIKQPLVLTKTEGKYDVICNVSGGGYTGQAGAIRLGIARSLLKVDEEEFRTILKKAGFLTRDPRKKERKKYGLKKARKKPQFSKR